MKSVVLTVLTAMLVLGGCGKKSPEKSVTEAPALASPDVRAFSVESLARGAALFQEHCAICHGPEAQGHPDWRNPSVTAAPPLNGSGNELSRTQQDFVAIVKNGANRNNQPVMPAWKGRLSDSEIEDLIVWFQALWPTDVYDRWRKANVSALTPKG